MFFGNQKFREAGHFLPRWPYVTISPPKMCFFGAKHQTPFETIKIPQFWHIGDLFGPFRLAAMTIFPEKGRISEMAIFAFVDLTKFLKIIKLTFFENFKQFLGSSPISICILRGPGWFFTKNLDHPIFPSEIAWMPSYISSIIGTYTTQLYISVVFGDIRFPSLVCSVSNIRESIFF